MPRAFRKIARYILASSDEFIHKPMRELSAAISVSEPSLIRFSRRYGFTGLPHLRLAVAMCIASGAPARLADLEPDIYSKSRINPEEKIAIATAARPLVETDSSVLLDSGSTVQVFATTLHDANPLKILCTGLLALQELRKCKQHTLMLPGGRLRVDAMSLTGHMVENTLASMSFDTAYVGADSIHQEFGLSTFSEEEAHLTSVMMRSARRVVVLADSSKFGAPSLHRICGISDVDIFVTDRKLSTHTRDRIQDSGALVQFCGPVASP